MKLIKHIRSLFTRVNDTGALQIALVVGVVVSAFVLSEALKPKQTIAKAVVLGEKSIASNPVLQKTTATLIADESKQTNAVFSFNGVVVARTQTDIAAQIGGRVTKVYPVFKAGSVIKKGDVLFEIEKADFELNLERTLAEVEAARSELALLVAKADIAKEDWAKLFPGQKITDLGARRPQIAAAKARVKSTVAARKKAELELARTTIRAPFSGRVLSTQLDVGQLVTNGQQVGQAANDSQIEIEVPVSLSDIAKLDPVLGRTVEIMTAASITSGLIDRQNAVLDSRTRLGTLYITPTDRSKLMIGEFIKIKVDAAPVTNALSMPVRSLVSGGQSNAGK